MLLSKTLLLILVEIAVSEFSSLSPDIISLLATFNSSEITPNSGRADANNALSVVSPAFILLEINSKTSGKRRSALFPSPSAVWLSQKYTPPRTATMLITKVITGLILKNRNRFTEIAIEIPNPNKTRNPTNCLSPTCIPTYLISRANAVIIPLGSNPAIL